MTPFRKYGLSGRGRGMAGDGGVGEVLFRDCYRDNKRRPKFILLECMNSGVSRSLDAGRTTDLPAASDA